MLVLFNGVNELAGVGWRRKLYGSDTFKRRNVFVINQRDYVEIAFVFYLNVESVIVCGVLTVR